MNSHSAYGSRTPPSDQLLKQAVENQPLFQLIHMSQKANTLITSRTNFLTALAMSIKSESANRAHPRNQTLLRVDTLYKRSRELPTSPVEFANSIWLSSPVEGSWKGQGSFSSSSSFSLPSSSPTSAIFEPNTESRYGSESPLSEKTPHAKTFMLPENAVCFKTSVSYAELQQVYLCRYWRPSNMELGYQVSISVKSRPTFLVFSVAGSQTLSGLCQVCSEIRNRVFGLYFIPTADIAGELPDGELPTRLFKEMVARLTYLG